MEKVYRLQYVFQGESLSGLGSIFKCRLGADDGRRWVLQSLETLGKRLEVRRLSVQDLVAELLTLLGTLTCEPPLELERSLLVGTERSVHVPDGPDDGGREGVVVSLHVLRRREECLTRSVVHINGTSQIGIPVAQEGEDAIARLELAETTVRPANDANVVPHVPSSEESRNHRRRAAHRFAHVVQPPTLANVRDLSWDNESLVHEGSAGCHFFLCQFRPRMWLRVKVLQLGSLTVAGELGQKILDTGFNLLEHSGVAGEIKYSALWMYNKLMGCRTVEQIQATKDSCFPHMDSKDIAYLNKLSDTSQYPAARCNMRYDVYMYHRQASAGAESMNAANFSIRQRTSVDLNNAMMLLIMLECKRYRKQQAEAWNRDGVFTSRGNLEFEASFNDLYHTQFRITVAEMDDVWVCSVKRIEMGREHSVTIPKEPVRGSHFGRCTCGVDRQDSAPCEHMAAVAASSCLPGVTRHNVMPYWWTRAHWRMQIPQEPLGITNVSMSSIIADNEPDHNLRYCPDWTANQKSGRPKKDKRKKSVLESATGSKGTKRATGVKRARQYCQICGKYNHITNECWKLGSNAHKRPGLSLDTAITEEGDGAPIDGTEGTADASVESNEEEEQSHEDSQTTIM